MSCKTVQEYNRNLFINALFNNDEIEIPEEMAIELIRLYDVRQAHFEEMSKDHEEYYERLKAVSFGGQRA